MQGSSRPKHIAPVSMITAPRGGDPTHSNGSQAMCKKMFASIAALCLASTTPAFAGEQLLPSLTNTSASTSFPSDAADQLAMDHTFPPEGAPDALAPQKEAPTTITAAERLTDPITKAVTFEGREDEVTYMSENGRYVIRGRLFDTWTGKVVASLADIHTTMQGLDLARYGMTEADLDPFTWGKGSSVVSVFVDPYCPYCAQLFDQLAADPSLSDLYTFKIYTVAYLGDDSVAAVNRLACHPDRSEALTRLMSHDTRWMRTIEVPKCPADAAVKRMMIAQALGIGGVPFLIGPLGGMSKGNPPDLRGFLESN